MVAVRIIILFLLPTLCVGKKGDRHKPRDMSTFVPWPDEAADLLRTTEAALKDTAPKIFTLLSLPGNDFFRNMQEVAVRNSYNSDLFQLDVKYMMADGLQLGCRTTPDGSTSSPDGGRIKEHKMGKWGRNKSWCHTHCTHQGRYCPVMNHEALKDETAHTGGDLVLEVLRRMCLGKLLNKGFSDPYFFDYINDFTVTYQCMKDGRDLDVCSHEILEKRLRDFPTGEGSEFEKCVSAADSNIDAVNPLLEDSLDFSHEMKKYTVADLPVLEINGDTFTELVRADRLQNTWCSYFEGDTKPITCDYCRGSNIMKNCLWLLRWNSQEFDINNYKHDAPPVASSQQTTSTASTPQENNQQEEDPKEDETETNGHPFQQHVAVVEEDVVKGSEFLLTAGFIFGVGGTGLLWFVVELKRRRAVAEVASELPKNGFRDDVRVV